MALLMIQHLSGGAWGVFRRIFEASSRTLPLLALLFMPVVLGMGSLYPWTHPDRAGRRSAPAQGAVPQRAVLPGARRSCYFAGWSCSRGR